MLSKNNIKIIQNLGSKKFRQKYNKFVVEGQKTSLEFLRSTKYEIEQVIITEEGAEIFENERLDLRSKIEIIDNRTMKQISHFKTHSPILLVCRVPDPADLSSIHNHSRILFLENIQDPGNLGTILRIADWFGISAIWTSLGSVDFHNPKTITASMGSILSVELYQGDFLAVKENYLSEHSFIGTVMEGKDYRTVEFPGHTVLCFGNEGQGLSRKTLAHLNKLVTIPKVGNGIAESLNISTAVAVLCAEWVCTK